jgi:hypothetical protein
MVVFSLVDDLYLVLYSLVLFYCLSLGDRVSYSLIGCILLFAGIVHLLG